MADRIDYLLLMIKEAEKIYGRTKLQKLMYLSKKTIDTLPYSFEWYNYGPFSRILSNDLTELVKQGLINEEMEGISLGDGSISERYIYSLSDTGLKYIQNSSLMNSDEKGKIDEIVKRFAFISRRELVEFVYAHYKDSKQV